VEDTGSEQVSGVGQCADRGRDQHQHRVWRDEDRGQDGRADHQHHQAGGGQRRQDRSDTQQAGQDHPERARDLAGANEAHQSPWS
jgi:hypothetical protein